MATLKPTAVKVGEHCIKFTYGPITSADTDGHTKRRLAMLGFNLLEELDRRDVVAVLLRRRALAELDLVGDDEVLGGRNRLAWA